MSQLTRLSKRLKRRTAKPVPIPTRSVRRHVALLKALHKSIWSTVFIEAKAALESRQDEDRIDATSFDLHRVKAKVASEINGRLRQIRRTGLEVAADNVKAVEGALGMATVASSTAMGNVLDSFVSRHVFFITQMEDSELSDAATLIQSAFNSGDRWETLQPKLMDRFNIGARRAEVIARTEISSANSEFTKKRFEMNNVTRFRWRTAKDIRVRDSHAELEGKEFDLANPPLIPKEGAHLPGAFPNCRCRMEPVIDWLEPTGESVATTPIATTPVVPTPVVTVPVAPTPVATTQVVPTPVRVSLAPETIPAGPVKIDTKQLKNLLVKIDKPSEITLGSAREDVRGIVNTTLGVEAANATQVSKAFEISDDNNYMWHTSQDGRVGAGRKYWSDIQDSLKALQTPEGATWYNVYTLSSLFHEELHGSWVLGHYERYERMLNEVCTEVNARRVTKAIAEEKKWTKIKDYQFTIKDQFNAYHKEIDIVTKDLQAVLGCTVQEAEDRIEVAAVRLEKKSWVAAKMKELKIVDQIEPLVGLPFKPTESIFCEAFGIPKDLHSKFSEKIRGWEIQPRVKK